MARRRRLAWLALPAGVVALLASRGRHLWSALTGVSVPADLARGLDRLADAYGGGFVVTSGYRSAQDQAEAMAWSRGLDYLLGLYADDATAEGAWDAYQAGGLDGAAEYLEQHPLSAHQGGDAADLSYWRTAPDGSTLDVDRMVNAAASIGASTVRESDHLHVEDLT